MPLNLASPGIVVREVDLTAGRVDPTSNATGAIVAPFAQGPVNEPVLVTNEQELLAQFGNPYSVDKHYESWMVASSFLAYGGSLQVVRCDDSDLKNAYAGSSGVAPKIKSYEDYVNLGYDENTYPGVSVAARNPGSWANGIKVCIVDAKADQILSGIDTTTINGGASNLEVGMGITQSMSGRVVAGLGTTSFSSGYLKGSITSIGEGAVDVKIISHVSAAGTETAIDYQPGGLYAFSSSGNVAIHSTGVSVALGSTSYTTRQDWFDNQTISLSNSTINWNSLADRPSTSTYASARGGRFDEIHVVVVDDAGSVTGNAGTILEKHLALSKATDAQFSVGAPSYWRKYISENSEYIFAGSQPVGVTTVGLTTDFNLNRDSGWDQNANSISFGGSGAVSLDLRGGLNYSGKAGLTTTSSLQASIGDIAAGYDIFINTEEYNVDFLLMGSGNFTKEGTQSLASKLISVAEQRKDAIAFVSPHRASQVTDSGSGYTVDSAADITDEVLGFYSSVPSSSFAIFDSGYKYMYDRFGDTFRYVPLNGDMAGLCARNDIGGFPWFSPAGTSRGGILNAVKLAYNPNKNQRDRLYSARINPVIFSPGSGIILFGDKTGLAKSSAFDRINVRRLFIYLEKAIAAAGKDVMFEFNDELTRSSFVNAVEPFLRDVQAKRGIQDFRLICDSTNNTAAVIDSNEFVADIYIKPSRSINFVGLTFVATRSGVSFEEVVGV